MSTTIQKWGNSLGVRLPKELTAKLKLRSGSRVSVTADDLGLVIKPEVVVQHRTLKELLKGMTKKNLHKATDWGTPVGKEVW